MQNVERVCGQDDHGTIKHICIEMNDQYFAAVVLDRRTEKPLS
jgi:hypothetical protein